MTNTASPLWLLSALFFLAASLFTWMAPQVEAALRYGMLTLSGLSLLLFFRAPRDGVDEDSQPAGRRSHNDL